MEAWLPVYQFDRRKADPLVTQIEQPGWQMGGWTESKTRVLSYMEQLCVVS